MKYFFSSYLSLYVYKSYVGSGGQVLSTDSQSTTTAVDPSSKGMYVYAHSYSYIVYYSQIA